MYRTIVLAYDGSLEGRLALREGARLAKLCQARVVLVAVVEPSPDVYTGDLGAVYVPSDKSEDVEKVLEEGATRLRRMGLVPESRLEKGQPVERITTIANEVQADLVVVGHHKQGTLARWLMGSVTASLSDSLSCSLLVARMDISDTDLFGLVAEKPD